MVYAGSVNHYRSSYGLATFSHILEAETSLTDIVFAPSAPDTVFAIAEGLTLYRSTDAGLTFDRFINLRSDVLNP
ncbi:MAG: hypothetical protein CME26_02215 [Gemmatimonadetes bacterium]|nr:hypothetical protein [Gemmatimonadota bacterium]